MRDNFIKNQMQFVEKDNIAIKEKGNIELIDLNSIVKFESDKNYTNICLNGGRMIISSRTLNLFEKLLLDKKQFMRVNRSEIINLNHTIFDNSELQIAGKKHSIRISRRRGLAVAKRIVNFSKMSH